MLVMKPVINVSSWCAKEIKYSFFYKGYLCLMVFFKISVDIKPHSVSFGYEKRKRQREGTQISRHFEKPLKYLQNFIH
jgi:hypothetical protein